MGKRTICNVDDFGHSILISPTDEEVKKNPAVLGSSDKLPKRHRKRAVVSVFDDSQEMSIYFPSPGELLQPPTIHELKRFTLCKLTHSKKRYQIRMSFDKTGIENAVSVLEAEWKSWFDEFRKHHSEEMAAAPLAEEVETKTNTKKTKKQKLKS